MCKLPGLSKLKNQTMKFDAVYLNEQLCLAEMLMNVPIGGGCHSNRPPQAASNLGLQNHFCIYTHKYTNRRMAFDEYGAIVTALLPARHAACTKPKAQAPRRRASAEVRKERQRQETATGLRSVGSVSALHPPPLHHCALHGSAKKHGSTTKRLRFALGSLGGVGKFRARLQVCPSESCHVHNIHKSLRCIALAGVIKANGLICPTWVCSHIRRAEFPSAPPSKRTPKCLLSNCVM